jgi:hypothetical protein
MKTTVFDRAAWQRDTNVFEKLAASIFTAESEVKESSM